MCDYAIYFEMECAALLDNLPVIPEMTEEDDSGVERVRTDSPERPIFGLELVEAA